MPCHTTLRDRGMNMCCMSRDGKHLSQWNPTITSSPAPTPTLRRGQACTSNMGDGRWKPASNDVIKMTCGIGRPAQPSSAQLCALLGITGRSLILEPGGSHQGDEKSIVTAFVLFHSARARRGVASFESRKQRHPAFAQEAQSKVDDGPA